MRRKYPGMCAVLLVLALVIGATPPAEAAPITGGISFAGAFLPTGGTGLADATGVDIIGNIAVVSCAITSTCTGSYAGITGLVTATYNDFTFNPLGGSTTPLWSLTFGGNTYTFDLMTVKIDEQDSNSLVLMGTGMLYINGLLATLGRWSFSGDTSGAVFAFSATNSVPEPASTLLLGLGLLGSAYALRRRTRASRR